MENILLHMDIQFLLYQSPLDKEGIGFSMYVFGTMVKNETAIAAWAFSFILFAHVSGFLPVSCYFG